VPPPPAILPPLPGRSRSPIGPSVRLSPAASLLLSGCCLAPAPDARFLRFPSFETPEAAFETLRAALRADDPALEYRCFSQAFRENYGLQGADSWRIARARILREHPEIRWVARARLRETTRPAPDRRAGIASVLGRRFRVEFVREEFFELTRADGTRIDDYLERPLRAHLSAEGERLRLDLADPRFRDLPLEEVERLLVGAEWKILDVGPPASSGTSP
jgi:hypothetical protein